MEKNEIEKLYSEDETVKKFIDGLADKRVNQYRDRFIDKDLPGLVESQVNDRISRDQKERDRLEREQSFRTQIADRLEAQYIDPKLGSKFFDDLGAESSEEEIESRFEEFKTLQEKTVQRVINERLGGKEPEALR